MTRPKHLLLVTLVIAASGLPSLARAQDDAQAHLLEGAIHFREGRFAEALVEFKVAERLGGPGEATWYLAATLTRLKRSAEALEAFARAEEVAPDAGDVLLDYYRAVASYEERLFLTARLILQDVASRAGPRIAAEARKLESEIEPLFRAPPSTQTVDWYYERGMKALQAGAPRRALAFLREAQALTQLRDDRHREGEVQAALERMRAGP